MSLASTKGHKELKLENDELKHLLLKLMSKYKTSEIKRNVLLQRNALLITDNKNLHKQLLETTKSKIISEKAVKSYQEAVKLLKNELKELKSETSNRCDQMDTTKSQSKSVECSDTISGKPVQQKSEEYFEVSDESLRDVSSFKSYESQPHSGVGTFVSDDMMTDAEAQSPSSSSQREDYVICSEMEAYYHSVPEKNIEINREEVGNEATSNQTESMVSNTNKNEEKDPFEEKRNRLWAQIKELREMTKVTDEELQTRRFAVAAKAEMIQNVQKEIKRMQTLVTLAR